MKRMSLKQFGQVVRRVMETLPEEFYQYLDNLSVDVEDEPSIRTLQEMGFTEEEIEAGESLYGLFVPMNVPTEFSVDQDVPHRLIIYKRPLEEDFTKRRELMIEIRKTVIHELAHHFGYTDRNLEKFDDTPNPFGDMEEDP